MSTARQSSVEQLAELYNVVIGVALSLSIYNAVDMNAHPIPVKLDKLVNVLSFLLIIIPFYHGAVRHLFATYVEGGGSTRIKNGALLADFYLLFIEGCLFVMMACVLNDTATFGWVVVSLLLLDCVWGFLAWLAFTGAEAQHAERIWSLINFFTAALLSIILIFASGVFVQKPLLSQAGLLAIIGARTILDYFACWNFYFPPADGA
jgi:hypothetical protein